MKGGTEAWEKIRDRGKSKKGGEKPICGTSLFTKKKNPLGTYETLDNRGGE